ncbi:hypothetical protein IW261DRAFT_1593971 [Armillaria novae-zelandiae]|uniref:CHAT domain-containing protein n=1 Tax=Armillaria novae-zelandiae TaxID=153914 RepID=A0AA39P789_9AGAR|nr:hypothetical protein IW261DRAFT_1593971 [Armillaria novae-zelandiae]
MIMDHAEDTTIINEILTTHEDGMPTFQWNIQYPESLRRELLPQRPEGTTDEEWEEMKQEAEAEWDEMQENANRILNGPEATNIFSGLISTLDEQIIPARFTLKEDEKKDEEGKSEEDEDEEFFSALSCQTEAPSTLQGESLTRSQSSENSPTPPRSPSSVSQELVDEDALIDILVYGITVSQGALRDLKHAALDEDRWSSFVEDCDSVDTQVTARLTKELVPWYLPFASLYTMALYKDAETSDSHRTTDLNRLVDFSESAISAVEQCSPAAPDIAAIHHNVGNGYYLRSQTTSGDDIDRAIEHFDVAIAIGSRAPGGMAMFLTCSARALASRYEKSHNFEDLQSAINKNEEALSLVSSDNPALNNTRTICLINGGNLLIHRYDASLQRDIAYIGESNLLGHAVSHFFSKKPDHNEDLAKAIVWIEKALNWCLLEVLQAPSIFQESYLQKLESSLQELEKGDTAAVATTLKHRACLATWRISTMNKTLFSPLDICDVARTRLRVLTLKSNDAAIKTQIDQAFESFEHASSLSVSTCDIMDQLAIASVWVSQALEMKHHSVAIAYPVLLRILRGCINLNPAIEIRHAIVGILRPISPADVAAAIMRSSSPNLAEAVELLEYGRDIVLSHIRAMRQDDERIRNLESMDSDAVVRFEAVCKQLDRNIHGLFLPSGWKWTSTFVPGEAANMETPLTWEDFLQRHSSDMHERETMSARLQDKDVLPMGPSPSYAELKQAATGGTVIIFNFSKYGCDALIIVKGKESPVRVPLGAETQYQYFVKLASALEASLKLDDTVESDEKLQKVLKALWKKAVEPVTKELKALGVEIGSRLWLLPTGLARLFPLHAAGPYKNKGFDPSDLSSLYAISYTSTLGVLLTAKAPRTLDEPPTVLFIGDDGEGNPAVEELPYVKAERDMIAKEFGDRATCLFRGASDARHCRLTLPAIMRSRSPQGEFAFYSACNTASSPDQTSGEVVNLASAMEVCGFRSVVGTLYPIHDDFAADVCREFYKSARSRGWTDAAYSLKDCMLELRKKMWEDAEEWGIRKWIAYIHIGI